MLRQRILKLQSDYGGLRALGLALEIDHAYLKRLRDGEKTNPSDAVLAKLGLEKVVEYRRRRRVRNG